MATKGADLVRKSNHIRPCFSFLIIYKIFVRPQVDHADIIYAQLNNSGLFHRNGISSI